MPTFRSPKGSIGFGFNGNTHREASAAFSTETGSHCGHSRLLLVWRNMTRRSAPSKLKAGPKTQSSRSGSFMVKKTARKKTAQTGGKSTAPAFREFEFTDGKSNKFWKIAVVGAGHIIVYGRIGTDGREAKKSFKSAAAAQAAADKLIEQKVDKGYIETAKPSPVSRTTVAGSARPKGKPRVVPADEALAMILDGDSPSNIQVNGSLDFSGMKKKFILPDHLSLWRLNVSDNPWLTELPNGLKCLDLDAHSTGIEVLPPDIQVELRLNLSDCARLTSLPVGLKVGSLSLEGCSALTSLPEELEVNYLNINRCTNLSALPKKGRLRFGSLLARDCARLKRLPDWIESVAQLDLSGCKQIKSLPQGIKITSWVDVAGSGLKRFTKQLDGVELRWRGASVTKRVAFQPHTLASREVLAEENAEVRRAMLDAMGFERFLEGADAEVVDCDVDARGGKRELFKVVLEGDENLVCVSVVCPSTGRKYLIRVPPDMKTCHQAVAWTAGFSKAEAYAPVMET
ncbi:MAG: WGR domain-containing protein [Planctomycetales bacterium]|nr:WGR domain-containing protein [Planctomycetales bacterium]